MIIISIMALGAIAKNATFSVVFLPLYRAKLVLEHRQIYWCCLRVCGFCPALAESDSGNCMSRSVRIQLSVFAAIVAVLATPFLIPLNTYRASLESAASRALSREVHIKGPLHLTVYPEIGVSLSDVTIANVPGARDPNMVTAGQVIVGAQIMPLFSGRLEVTELTLKKAAIHLEVAKNAA